MCVCLQCTTSRPHSLSPVVQVSLPPNTQSGWTMAGDRADRFIVSLSVPHVLPFRHTMSDIASELEGKTDACSAVNPDFTLLSSRLSLFTGKQILPLNIRCCIRSLTTKYVCPRSSNGVPDLTYTGVHHLPHSLMNGASFKASDTTPVIRRGVKDKQLSRYLI